MFLLCVIQDSSAIACTLIFSSCSSSTMGCRQRWQANEAGCFSASVMFMPQTLSNSLHKIVYFLCAEKNTNKINQLFSSRLTELPLSCIQKYGAVKSFVLRNK